MRSLAPLLALALAGCYTYNAAPINEIAPGRDVRVALTDSGSLQVSRLVGPRAAALEGRFAARTDTAFTMNVSQIVRFDGTEETWRGERVAVPRTAFSGLERRQLSRPRSFGLAGGVLAVAVVAIRAFQGSEEVARGGGRPGGGNTQ